ncbi:MAG TPA: endonuclease/exonuclease/phosphatase family protein [Microlunatus sp.]|nr:endonuclease/exonuclease/phosphatase family protein [Microlunatus sp.]
MSRRVARLLVALALSLVVGVSTLVAGPMASAATAAPAGLTVVSRSTTAIAVSWRPVSGAPKYRLQVSRTSSMRAATYHRVASTRAELSGLRAGTTYYVKVRVISASGSNLSAYSKAVKATTRKATSATSKPLRVGSYNIKCSNCFSGLPEELPWSGRRAAVAATIEAADLDVVGLQEAGQAWLKDDNGKAVNKSQFEDLVDLLGSPWKLTNTKRNNCVKDTTPTHCTYADQGASQGTKIIYNSDRIEMIDSGSKRLSYLKTTSNQRYVAWAVLRQRSTGQKFFFADTHLEAEADRQGSTANYELRRKQAGEVVSTIKANNTGKLPVVAVGDFNSHKFTAPSNAPYDVMVNAGYVDSLGNTYGSTRTAPGATVEKRVRTYVNSFNDFVRTAPSHPTWINGTYIDYIFTSKLRVSEFENVANLDSAGRFVGVIPSDHNLMRATVWLS